MKLLLSAFLVFAVIDLMYAASCDIYIASKCPTPPAYNERFINSTQYCKGLKDYVDCINKKLRFCKNVQEYGPALETIKWSVKVLIDQGRSHGCEGLSDKIKLPRIPRKKWTTTEEPVESTTKEIESQTPMSSSEETRYLDPNCNQNLASRSCASLDFHMNKYLFKDSLTESFLNKTGVSFDNLATCQAVIKYKKCMDLNFYIKCQKTFQTLFEKLDRSTSICMNSPTLANSRHLMNTATPLKSFYTLSLVGLSALIMVQKQFN